jgi:UDP-N-acetyl-D-galactosamine dehydrogenase
MVAAVAHKHYHALSVEQLASKVVPGGGFVDVKASFDSAALGDAGLRVWRL